MAKIKYVSRKFTPTSGAIIIRANAIIEEYAKQGFELTLRQLYYQFVARGLLDNKQKEYKNLGSIISDARLAGLIDWDAIVDRTRSLRSNSHWEGPGEIVRTAAGQFQIDKWDGQEYRPEVWIEKDALVGVIDRVCRENDVGFFSCRGYTSQSEMHAAAMRLKSYRAEGQEPVIIHLGDHDPSGIDMSRDIADRMHLFIGNVEVKRIALNMDQVRKYNPPPNPSKLTDPRAKQYLAEHGDESWELDALDPKTLERLIQKTIDGLRDDEQWEEKVEIEREHRATLTEIADKLEKKKRK